MFEWKQHFGGEYNKKRASEGAFDPMERVRESYPELFQKPEQYATPEGEYASRALARRNREAPAPKKTSTWKFLILAFIAGIAGGKYAQTPEYTPLPQSGFSNTVPSAPLLESHPNAFSPGDRDDLEAWLDSITAEGKAAREALAQAFLQNYLDALKSNKQAFEKYGDSQMTMGAFYNAMIKNRIDISLKEAVAKALRDKNIIEDAFSIENFPGLAEEKLKKSSEEFFEILAGYKV